MRHHWGVVCAVAAVVGGVGCAQEQSITDPSHAAASQRAAAPAAAMVVTVSPTAVSARAGDSVRVEAGVKDGNGQAILNPTITWTSQDTTVATVSATGTVHLRKAGATKVFAVLAQDTAATTVTVQAAAATTAPASPPAKSAPATPPSVPPSTSPSPSSGTEFGVHADLVYNGSASYHTQGVQALTALHAKVSRSSFLWSHIEPNQGSRDWSVTDDVVNKLTAANIDPLMTVYGSPAWANGSSNFLVVPTDAAAFANWVAAYADFMSAAATRYKGRITKWELWNEENQHFFWQPKPNVTQYNIWFKAVYAAIKAADPSATVSIGGMVGLCCGPTGDYSGEAFLKAVYAAGITPDAVSIHPYTGDPSSTTAYQNDFSDIAVIHSIMVANGQATTPMWITEWGWGTNGSPSATTAAAWLTTSLNMIATQYKYVTVATYFQLQDLPPQYYYGLYDSAWTLKAGGTAFATFAATH